MVPFLQCRPPVIRGFLMNWKLFSSGRRARLFCLMFHTGEITVPVKICSPRPRDLDEQHNTHRIHPAHSEDRSAPALGWLAAHSDVDRAGQTTAGQVAV